DLAWIHDVVRIERMLDRAHDIDRAAEFALQERHLALTDAMLARAGAVHGDRPHVEAGDEGFRRLDLLRVLGVEQQRHMEIAVADMTDDRAYEAVLGNIDLGRLYAFGKP